MRGKQCRFKKSAKKSALKLADCRCSVCGCMLTMATAEPHHIRPVSDGGLTVTTNCQIVCRPCHVDIHQAMLSGLRNIKITG